jgi:hypothetical protein
MTNNDIAKLSFKLLAVYFVMQIFYQSYSILTYYFYSNEIPEHEKVNFIIAVFPSVLFFLFGIILWFIAPYLANAVFKPKPDDTNSQVSVEDYHSVAFSVAGLYLLTMSLSAIVEFIVHNLQMVKTTGESPLTSLIIIAVFKIVIGLWLILGSKGIVNAIRRLRRA